jgi:hypothetical protein
MVLGRSVFDWIIATTIPVLGPHATVSPMIQHWLLAYRSIVMPALFDLVYPLA